MFKIMRKLKTIKYDLKDWLKKNFGNIHERMAKNAHKIDYVEERLIVNANSHRFNSWRHRLLKQRRY